MSTSPEPVNGLPGTTQDSASTLVLASRMISTARDQADMALAVLYTVGQTMTAVGMTLLDMADSQQAQARMVTALVTVDDAQAVDPAPRADLLPSPEQLETLRRGLPVVPDLNSAGDLTRRELQPLQVRWMASFGLRANDNLLGTLDLFSSQPQELTTETVDAYAALADQIGIVLQNRRLLQESQNTASELSQQVRLLQILNQLAMTSSSDLDEQRLFDNTCRALIEITELDHCSIAMLTPAATASQVISEYPVRGTVGVQIPLAENRLYQIIEETRQPLVVEDVNSDTRLPPASQHLLQRMGVRAMLVIPLFVSDRLAGSIGIDVYAPDKQITPRIVEAAQLVAAQVGLGLQNVRLLADAQRRAEQLQRITAFSQSSQATLDLSTVFNNMLAECARMLPQDHMSITLYDAAQSALRVVAEQTGGITSTPTTSEGIIPMTGQVAAVWNSRELLHIPDTYAQRERTEPDNDLRSWMLAPIVIRGRALGIVSVGSLRPYAYTDTDQALFQQMVTQLAVAIENTEAYTQSQRMVKNETLLNTISTQLQNQMDIERMMELTANELGKALGARRARIRFGSPDGSS